MRWIRKVGHVIYILVSLGLYSDDLEFSPVVEVIYLVLLAGFKVVLTTDLGAMGYEDKGAT